jgi:hypothetical protein
VYRVLVGFRESPVTLAYGTEGPENGAKLKQVADALRATILRPYYPASDLYRIVRDEDGLQVDFMSTVHGRGLARLIAAD